MSHQDSMRAGRKKSLEEAFEYADEYVLQNTNCPTREEISNGWCEVWAKAVRRKARFAEIQQRHGHWFVVYDDVAYDSDTTETGFAPQEIDG